MNRSQRFQPGLWDLPRPALLGLLRTRLGTRLVRGVLALALAVLAAAALAEASGVLGARAAVAQTSDVVTLSVSPTSALESAGATSVSLRATLVGTTPATSDVTVSVTVSGTATSGTDYTALGTVSVTIPSGQLTGTTPLSIDPTEDTVYEGTGETIVFGGSATGGVTGSATAATFTITDNDDPDITLSVSPSSLLESANSTTVTVTATMDNAPTSDTTVTLSVDTTSTAISGTDYADLGTLDSITIAGGSTSGTATVAINPTEDTIDEGTGETIVIAGAATSLTVKNATFTITDNDDTPTTINLSASPASIDEDDASTAVTITATLDGATRTVDTVVSLNSTLGGTATGSGTDYTASGLPSSVTIAAESSSGSATGLMIDPDDDDIDEGTEETIVINGSAADFTVNGATINLNDNDDPEITLTSERVGSGDDHSVDEGDSAMFRITATRNTADRSKAVSVTLAVQAASTATSGTDFTALSSTTISIPINQASGARNVTVSTTEDRFNEGTGETIVLGATVTGFTVNPVTITIADDDADSTSFTLTVDDDSIEEDDDMKTTVTVTAELDDAVLATDVTVALTLGGTATSGTDYADPGTLTSITITAGEVSGDSSFDVDPTDDNIDEDDETITVNGSATGGLTTTASVDITLEDDDTAAITLSTGTTTSIGEGDAAATSVTVTATLDIARSKSTTVALTLSGTAVSGTDYTVPSTLPSITLAAGSKTGTASFDITPTEDRLDEGTGETITITGSADGVTSGSTNITLTDNDDPSTAVAVTLVDPDDETSPVSSIGESAEATSVKVTATLNDAAVKTTTNMVLTFAGSAVTTDYSITPDTPPPKVTFNPGEHEASITISIHPTHDLIDENDETIVVGVSSTLTVTTATIDLTDDDTASNVTLTVDESNVREADGGTLFLDTGVATRVTVTATIDDGITRLVDTAVTLSLSGTANKGTAYGDGIDYKVSSTAPGSITIGEGDNSATTTFTITPQQDSLTEGDETITVGGTVSDLTLSSADITLRDDDTASTSLSLYICCPSGSVPRTLFETSGSTSLGVSATLDGGTLNGDLTVSLMLGGAARGDGVDYSLTESLPEITIPAGKVDGSANLHVDPVDDRIDEGAFETVVVSGTATESGSSTSFEVHSHSFRINDNDRALTSITLSVDPDRVDENATGTSSVTVTATLAGSVSRSMPTEVELTLGGSATLNTDYTATPGDPTVTIAEGALTGTGTITIDPDDDFFEEGAETIILRGAATGFYVGETVINLIDDERPPPAAITDLAAVLQGRNAVRLSWTRPSPGPITGYRLQRSTGGGNWANVAAPSRYSTSYIYGGLAYNTEYRLRLYARNSDGEGLASNEVNVTTGNAPPPGGGGGGPVGGGGGGPVGGGGGGGDGSPAGPPPGLSVPVPLSRTPSFSDVPSGSVLGPGIQRAARLGIMPGVGDGRFEPDRPVTRLDTAAPMVRLWQALGGTCPRATRTPFRDLPARGSARVDIACLHAEGVVAGTGAVTYSPDRVLNRAQMMTLMARMWRLRGHECPDDAPDPFADVSEGHYHRDDILCMYALGVTRGTGATTFSPDRQLTRAEVAVFAARFHDAVPAG